MEDNSLEERRRKNIERNQQFLLQLFASQVDPSVNTTESPGRNHSSQYGDGVTSSGRKRRQVDENDLYEQDLQLAMEREKHHQDIERRLCGKYPERCLQIQQLSEYLTLSELVGLSSL